MPRPTEPPHAPILDAMTDPALFATRVSPWPSTSPAVIDTTGRHRLRAGSPAKLGDLSRASARREASLRRAGTIRAGGRPAADDVMAPPMSARELRSQGRDSAC